MSIRRGSRRRYIQGDNNGKRSGRPRFKTEADSRSFKFPQVKQDWTRPTNAVLYLPFIGGVQIRLHRPLPDGFNLKTVQVSKKADGWYVNLCIEDPAVLQDEDGKFLPNGQSAKSGLNKSWNDATFGAFFKTLEYIAEKALSGSNCCSLLSSSRTSKSVNEMCDRGEEACTAASFLV